MNFINHAFLEYDDYMTPRYAWDDIKHLIPNDEIIWEAFYGDGTSGNILNDLGFNVIHEPIDFFENNEGTMVLSNPPFKYIPEILERLVQLDKKFILLMPSSKINTQYFRKLFKDKKIQIIIPKKRISFIKDGTQNTNRCNFDCFYYCYKMDYPNDIIWLQ